MVVERCPFCGSVGSVNSLSMLETFHVVCWKCGAKTNEYDTPEEAADAWNRRYYPKDMISKKKLLPSINSIDTSRACDDKDDIVEQVIALIDHNEFC